jgi:hypothetical protein
MQVRLFLLLILMSLRTAAVAYFFQAPLSEHATFLVTDTNILLHHFEVLAQFVDEVERNSLPVIVIVPGAVIYELDGCVLISWDLHS